MKKENAELKEQLEELRFEVGANLKVINTIVGETHKFFSDNTMAHRKMLGL